MLELLTGRRAVDLTLGPNDQNLVLQVRTKTIIIAAKMKIDSKFFQYRTLTAMRISQVRHILNDKKKLRKVIDPEINRSSYTMESVTMFANLASRSVRADSSERPSMVDCVKELQLILHTNMKGLSMPMHTFRMI